MATSEPAPFNLSDEDPVKMCDPCSYQGVNTQAGTFCTVCSEYLCHSCEGHHRSLKATRDHELKPFDEGRRKTIKQRALVSTIMTCEVHNTESLTQFCLTHATAICVRCFNKKHRRCEVNIIKDISQKAEIKTDVEQFLGKAKTLLKQVKEIKDSRKTDKEKIQKYCRKSKQDVQDIKMRVIEWIENLVRDMEDRISNMEEELTTEVDNDISAMDDLGEEIEEVVDSFETLDTADEDATFVLVTTEKHKTDEGEEAKDRILQSIRPLDLEFHPSEQLVSILSEITEIGTFDKYHRQAEMTSAGMCETRDPPICFTELTSMVRQDVDMKSSGASGSVFMPDGRLVVCEYWTESFRLYDENFKLKNQKTISSVWGVAVITENQVIVTQKDKKSLTFLNVSDTIDEGKTIAVDMPCYGVDCKNDRLYVSCHNNDAKGGVVKVLTMSGDSVASFNIDQGFPSYLVVNNTADRIVVSKGLSHGIEWFDIHGTALSSYTDSQLSFSRGVVYDSCDNVMVCGYSSHNIHVVDSNGAKHKVLLTSSDGISLPWCLAYRNSDKTLVVGQSRCSSYNKLLVFKYK